MSILMMGILQLYSLQRTCIINLLPPLRRNYIPKPISTAKANYNTHIRGKWCTISSDNDLGTLTLNGPGRKLWRETVFIRFAYHLYQQYKTETDADLNGSVFAQNSLELPGLGSHSFSLPLMSPVLPTATGNDELQTQLVTSISHEVHELKQISQLLKDQVSAIESKIDLLLKKEEIQRSSTMSLPTSFITRSEVSGDSTRLSPGPQSYSEIINSGNSNKDNTSGGTYVIYSAGASNDSIVNNTNNDEDVNSSKSKSDNRNSSIVSSASNVETLNTSASKSDTRNRSKNTLNSHPQKSQSGKNKQSDSRTLLIGDSIISGVNNRGLAKNVECVSISGGNIDSISNKLEIFDISKFGNLIITVGGNDASNKSDLEIFHNKFSDLIKTIKLKNSKCKLFLCTSCPRGDTDVTDINDVILQLCQENEITCIDVNINFYDKKNKNELKYHFYKPRDSIHLSRSGTKGLLGSINNYISVVENFEKCVFTPHQTNNTNKPTRGPSQPTQADKAVNQGSARPDHNRYGQYHQDNAANHGSARLDHEWHGHYCEERLEKPTTERCLKCGLTNHATFDCFHRKQVQCYKCKCYGHKDYMGLCWNK